MCWTESRAYIVGGEGYEGEGEGEDEGEDEGPEERESMGGREGGREGSRGLCAAARWTWRVRGTGVRLGASGSGKGEARRGEERRGFGGGLREEGGVRWRDGGEGGRERFWWMR